MKHILTFAFFLMLGIANVFADKLSEQMTTLAQNGVDGKNANGEPQTTIVDQNGNLKVVPLNNEQKTPPANSVPTHAPNVTPNSPAIPAPPANNATPPNATPPNSGSQPLTGGPGR